MSIGLQTDFAGGNGRLLSVDEAQSPPLVRFAAEPRNCPEAMWFHFLLTGLRGRGARCTLANPEQTLGGWDWSTNRIVWRRPDGPFARSGPAQRIDLPGGRAEWAWDWHGEGDVLEVAHCLPYQLADLEATLAETRPGFQATQIGVTQAGRPILRLFNRTGDGNALAVYLTARSHAGETPGSWVLDGLLRHVAQDRRLQQVVWWAVPFVNLDDVVEGSYGKDPWPHDCNRAYGPGGAKRAEVGAVVADVRRLKATARLRFLCDLHAPSHREQSVYVPLRGWGSDSPINPIGERFAERLHAATPTDIRSPIAHLTPRPGVSRQEGLSASRWARDELGIDAICLEASYQGNGRVYYGVADYRRIGAALAETIAAWVQECP
jgi:predicted deacylase